MLDDFLVLPAVFLVLVFPLSDGVLAFSLETLTKSLLTKPVTLLPLNKNLTLYHTTPLLSFFSPRTSALSFNKR